MDFLGIFFTVIGLLLLLVFLRFFFQVLWPIIRQVRALNKAQKELPSHHPRRSGRNRGLRRSGITKTYI